MRSVRKATSAAPSPSRHSFAPYASPTAIRTTEIGACTPPNGATPGSRRPVRTITLPPISSRRIRFGEPTSSLRLGRHRRGFQPEPVLPDRCGCLVDDPVSGLPAPLERQVEARQLDLQSDHVPREHAQRFLEQLLAGLVAFEDDDRLELHRRRRLAAGPFREGVATWLAEWGGAGRGSKRRFRYFDAAGREITDEAKLERIAALAIPPAWRDVWIAPTARAKLQATGVDAAGRTQYLYHPEYRARQEQAKYDKLIRFAERLPELRRTMSEHMALEGLPPERVAAIAVRLINLGWFRVGSDRYAKTSRTFGITTLRKCHVAIRGSRISFRYRGKHGIMIRSAIVDQELAGAVRELLALPGTRLFQFELDGGSLQPRQPPPERVHP